MFSLRSFIVLALWFWVNFSIWYEEGIYSFTYADLFVPMPHPLERLFLPHWMVLAKNQMAHVWVYIWTLSSIPLVHMSIHVLALRCFNYCSFVVSVEIRKYESFNLFFFKIILAVWGPLKFPMNLRISFPFLQKIAIGILRRIVSDL